MMYIKGKNIHCTIYFNLNENHPDGTKFLEKEVGIVKSRTNLLCELPFFARLVF